MSENTGYSLFWRPDRRRWIMSAPDTFGVWRQRVLPEQFRKQDRVAAERWVQETLAGRAAPHRPELGPIVSDVAPRWLALRQAGSSKPSTVVDNETHVRLYILPAFGALHMQALADDLPTIRRWVRDVRGKVSPSRCRNIASSLGTMFDDAKGEGWIRFAENPMRSGAVTKELPPLPVHKPVTLDLEDAQALLDSAAPLPRRVRYSVAFTTACPDGELSGLKWRDVGEDTIDIARAQLLVGKKGSKDHLGEPKNKFRVRTLPLHPCAIAALKEWRVAVAVLLGRAEPLPDDPVFPGLKRGGHARPDSAKLIRRDLVNLRVAQSGAEAREEREAVRKAADEEFADMDFHATRRSLLTWLADLDVQPAIRKRIAGHSRGDVTEEHYTKRGVEQLREAVNRVRLTWPTVPGIVSPGTTGGGNGADTSENVAPPVRIERTNLRFRKPNRPMPTSGHVDHSGDWRRLLSVPTDGLHTPDGSLVHCADGNWHSGWARTFGEALDASLGLGGGA